MEQHYQEKSISFRAFHWRNKIKNHLNLPLKKAI